MLQIRNNWIGISFTISGLWIQAFCSKWLYSLNLKGNQPWIFIGKINAEVEAPILWPPNAKSWFIRKNLMLGNIEGRRRRGRQGWVGWMASPTQRTWVLVNSRNSEGQGCLECYSPWSHKNLDMAEQLNNNSLNLDNQMLLTD